MHRMPVSRLTQLPLRGSALRLWQCLALSLRRFLSSDPDKRTDVERLKSETSKNELEGSAELTGVLDYLKLKEVLIFFDNIYPRWLAKLGYGKYVGPFFKSWQRYLDDDRLKGKICELIDNEKHSLPPQAKCEEFVPLKRDGGAFVKFLVPPDSSSKDLTAAIENNIRKYKEDHNGKFLSVVTMLQPFTRALLVKGTPWIEDLSRFPSFKLKVMFEGEPLTEEELYLLFRRYGSIVDIIPPSSTTSYATVIFNRTDACIRAKNCITGMSVNNDKTTLHLQYIPIRRVNYITSFISNHQRIAIPVILALLAAIAVLIFEPIREQFIEFKIKHYYSWDTHKDHWLVKLLYAPYHYVRSQLSDGRHFFDDSLTSLRGYKKEQIDVEDLEADMFWSERTEKANHVKLWVCENANTFIVVKGPKGSGKREFVLDHALNTDSNLLKKVLEIDCAALIKARSDNAFLKAAAGQLGYFPLFTWTSSISQYVDLGLQGLTGQKSGLSESKEQQYKNMLLLVSVAIRKVALEHFPAYKCEFERQQKKLQDQKDGLVDLKVVEAREEEYLQLHPEVKPVVVINNFLRKSDTNDFVFKALADWAGQLIQSNTAHVIVTTLDSGSVSHLTAALPNQVFKTIALDDASQQSAKQYVQRQLKGTPDVVDADACLEPIGGRMLDLQAFVRRVKSGERAQDALNEMIHQAAEQISAFFLNVPTADSDITWTTAQIWGLMRLLARKDVIDFDELVQSPLFVSNYDTVQTLSLLEKNDLIALKRDKGMVKLITTGRPLFRAAFKDLVNDPKIFKVFESHFYSLLISVENAKITKLEDELAKISPMTDLKYIRERAEYLSKKISTSTAKVQGYEAKVKELDKIGEPQKSSSFFGF